MIKRFFSLILIFLLLTTLVFAASRAVKIDDKIYAGDLANAPEGVTISGNNGIDNTDTIDFLVNDAGYNLKVESNLPDSVSFTLVGTEQTITVRIHQESSFVLADGSTVFIRYLEYDRLASDIKLRLGNEGSGIVQDTAEETEQEELTAEEDETAGETTEEQETAANETDKGADEEKPVLNRRNMLIGGAAAVLIIILAIAFLIAKKRKKHPKKESEPEKNESNPNTSSKSSGKEESFFDPIKD